MGKAERPGYVVLVVFIAISVALVTVYMREGQTGPVHSFRSMTQTILTPLDRFGAWVSSPFVAIGDALENASTSDETIQQLKEENAHLLAQLAELNEYKLANERLQAMLDFSGAYGVSGVGGRVIGMSSDSWTRTVTIDCGSSKGVVLDDPVTDGYGLIGQVASVSANSCLVRLIGDSSSTVSVRVQGCQAVGVLTGSEDGTLHLKYIETSMAVQAGDLVVTSGLGGTFPSGILVGTVSTITSASSDSYYSITVEPLTSLQIASGVFVITSHI